MVKQVHSVDEFKGLLGDKRLVVVDFYATWCGPCKMIAPKLEEWSQNEPSVLFVKVDVDEVEELAAEYGVSAMPTLMFFKNGIKVEEIVGANLDKICEAIQKNK
ncbi:hypothetical protein C0Q70_02742 [Pomacea canaliculata]|uniref:Thioredoxin n=1 Tax=Pomacea canaliculata TaxID=400727 RepID=A0A2T7PQT8_POMCA|nr:thioredoxin-1-like [Pomacea canaliculata]PVD35778.1 hypothetical protein C0Q70_02742 [Pomacea canaliculata]